MSNERKRTSSHDDDEPVILPDAPSGTMEGGHDLGVAPPVKESKDKPAPKDAKRRER